MNLFALSNINDARIVRLPLTQAMQTEIGLMFRAQEVAFMDGIDSEHEFDGRYNPDHGELLKISDFDDVDGISDAIRNPLAVTQYDPQLHSLDQVKAIFSGYTDDGGVPKVLIQVFDRKRLLSRPGVSLFYSGNTFQKMEESGLCLDTKLLAILQGPVIKFQSFHFLRRIFELDAKFQAATDPDIRAFAGHQSFSVQNIEELIRVADTVVRKKISFIQQSGILNNHTTQTLQTTALSFGLPLALNNAGKIQLPSERSELKKILRFLDEDYFEAPISKTKFLSNSKRVAN